MSRVSLARHMHPVSLTHLAFKLSIPCLLLSVVIHYNSDLACIYIYYIAFVLTKYSVICYNEKYNQRKMGDENIIINY